MTVERNYAIAIAMLDDWLKNLASFFQPIRSKTKYLWRATFPTLSASYRSFLEISTGSSRYLRLFGLVGIITLVLVFLQSFGNSFIDDELKTALSLRAFIKGTLRRRENFRQLGMLETLAIND